MNQVRQACLTEAAKEAMRPMALTIANKILEGQLYGTAVQLFGHAVKQITAEEVDDPDMPEIPEGWDDYHQDCLDLLESYKILQAPQRGPWVIIAKIPSMDALELVRTISFLETQYSREQTEIRHTHGRSH